MSGPQAEVCPSKILKETSTGHGGEEDNQGRRVAGRSAGEDPLATFSI